MKSIVIYRLGSMGDTVVALPCLHSIARAFPKARKIFLTNVPVAQNAADVELILRGSGLADEFVSYSIGLRQPNALMGMRRKLSNLDATTLIYLSSTAPPRDRLLTILRDLMFFRFCGFRTIIGAPVRRDLRSLRVDPVTGYLESEAERLVRCISPLGPIDLSDPESWNLRLTAEETAAGHRFLEPLADRDFIAVHVGGKVPSKDWGDANWYATMENISKMQPRLGLLLVGSADERERNERLMAHWIGPALNAAGRLTPRVSGAAIRHARLFVGHDSGPMHLAAAFGVPCLALFGSNNRPRKWHPLGPNWTQHRVIHDTSGLHNISQHQALQLVENMLGTLLPTQAGSGTV